MGLFNKLFYLRLRNSNNPYEDYLTEIFAECLKDNNFQNEFLSLIGIVDSEDHMVVQTQETFKKLSHHTIGSKPDVTIYGLNHTIFIEAKLSSNEGIDQLQRYAEHLEFKEGRKLLVYLTEYYDPKDKAEIIKNCENSIEFVQIRWHQVYACLEKINSTLHTEFKKYMEDKKMNRSHQFAPADIIALTGFSKVRSLMDNTMGDEVLKRFEECVGKPRVGKSIMENVEYHERYLISTQKANNSWMGLGYYLNPEGKDYPNLRLVIEVDPNSPKYREIVSVFQSVSNNIENHWKGYALNEAKAWAGIYIQSSLKEHLAQEDHVQSVKYFFLNSLDEYEKIIDDFGGLI
jgi:hypothetical protein